MFHRFTLIITAILIPLLISTAQKRAFTIEDIYKVKGVGSQTISNDGSKIAFTVSISDLRKSKSNTDIYIMNSDRSDIKQITTNLSAD